MTRKFAPLLVLGALLLAACGQPTAAPPAATHTVTDMTGHQVSVPVTVNKVGTNYPAVNQILYMLGAMDKLVATDKTEAATGGLFTTMYPRLKSISAPFTAASANVNAEELLRDKPDVVFVSSSSPAAAKVQSLGIPAVSIAAFNSPKQLEDGVTLIASVLGGGAPAVAQKFRQYYDGAVRRATDATAKLPPTSRPKVYYTANGPLSTEGGKSIVTTWMNQAGADNIAALHGVSAPPVFATVTLENLIAWNPDFIICRDASAKQQILADPRWQGVTAVRTHHVIANPKGVFVWSVRSGESALQPLWAAKTFHPDLFANLDIKQEVRNFYQTFYHHTLTDAELSGILNP